MPHANPWTHVAVRPHKWDGRLNLLSCNMGSWDSPAAGKGLVAQKARPGGTDTGAETFEDGLACCVSSAPEC